MASEIERKFLVADCGFLAGREGIYLKQGYIPGRTRAAARIRIRGDEGYIALKSETTGISRSEYEYEIPLADAEEMLELFCEKPFVEKTRYEVEYEGMRWEVDVFYGANEGLALAEL
jgi:CYTH domain-containing protein